MGVGTIVACRYPEHSRQGGSTNKSISCCPSLIQSAVPTAFWVVRGSLNTTYGFSGKYMCGVVPTFIGDLTALLSTKFLWIPPQIVSNSIDVTKLIFATNVKAKKRLEPTKGRCHFPVTMADMPFSDGMCLVASAPHDLGQGFFLEGQTLNRIGFDDLMNGGVQWTSSRQ